MHAVQGWQGLCFLSCGDVFATPPRIDVNGTQVLLTFYSLPTRARCAGIVPELRFEINASKSTLRNQRFEIKRSGNACLVVVQSAHSKARARVSGTGCTVASCTLRLPWSYVCLHSTGRSGIQPVSWYERRLQSDHHCRRRRCVNPPLPPSRALFPDAVSVSVPPASVSCL
eukprot:2352688-Rhodomonas_salina.1